MRQPVGLLILGLFVAVVCGLTARTSPQAVAGCDNKCRQEFDFYLRNGASSYCLTYSAETCNQCVYEGGCDNSKPALAGSCSHTLPNPTKVPVYPWTDCKPACTCPANQSYVQATSNGKGSDVLDLYIWVCRP
jgi:hypothetical protein